MPTTSTSVRNSGECCQRMSRTCSKPSYMMKCLGVNFERLPSEHSLPLTKSMTHGACCIRWNLSLVRIWTCTSPDFKDMLDLRPETLQQFMRQTTRVHLPRPLPIQLMQEAGIADCMLALWPANEGRIPCLAACRCSTCFAT